MKKLTKILAGSWITLAFLTVFPSVVSANGNLTIIVKDPNQYTGNQSSFNYEKKAGEAIEDVAIVKNFSDKPIKAHVYAVDATSNDSGSFILKLENELRTGIGQWTKLGTADILTIPPHQSVDFPFHIQIPDNIVPGQYFGGLVLEEIDDSQKLVGIAAATEGGGKICCTNILVKTRIGLRIYLTVPGIINDRMEWSGFKTVQKSNSTNFQFEIKNTGNVALEPIATIEIFDGMGNQVDRIEKSLGESLPGTYINPVISWENRSFFGNYKAVSKLDYQIKNETGEKLHASAELQTKTANFTVMPWRVLFSLLLLAAGSGIGYWIYLRKQKEIKLHWETYQVQPRDNIMNVAENHDVDWKKLARVNKLKAPYLLKNGEKIKVPKKTRHNQQSLFDDKHHE